MNTKNEKFRLGILPVMIDLYNRLRPELKATLDKVVVNFSEELSKLEIDVFSTNVVSTSNQAENGCKELLSQDIDLLVVGHVAYCQSGELVKVLQQIDAPILLWPVQSLFEVKPDSLDDNDLLLNHGVHGTQDLANMLGRMKIPFGLLHGHTDQPDCLAEVLDWLRAGRIIQSFRNANPVQIGGDFEGMLDLQIGDENFGLHVHTVDVDELASRMDKVESPEIAGLIAKYRETFEISDELDEGTLQKSACGELAVRDILDEQKSQAVGINFLTLCNDTRIADGLHVAASNLMSEGFGYGAEGDWVTASFVRGLQQGFGNVSFSEIFTVGYKDNRLVLKHWGEGNILQSRSKPRLTMSKFNDKIQAEFPIVDFEFKPGKCLLVNLNVDQNGKGKLISIPGNIEDCNLPKLSGPRAVFKPDADDVRGVLNEYARLGGSHHLAIVYDECEKTLSKLARLANWSYHAI